MTTDKNIMDEKLQNYINKVAVKISALLSGNLEKYRYLTGEEILFSNQKQVVEPTKFTYSPLGKAFEKQMEVIKDQWDKQVETTRESHALIENMIMKIR